MRPLEVERLTVRYPNGYRALEDVDLHIAAGQRVAVVGRSGSGKSTLVRAILGLLPSGTTVSGSVRVAGTELLDMSERDLRAIRGRWLGYVPQNPYTAYDPLRTVGHHVAAAWAAHRENPPPGTIETELTSLGIDAAGRMRQHPHQWSGGMLQRATLVAAGAHAPQVTLADEPTSALDAASADDVLELITHRCSALLLISHDLGLVGNHADRVAVLADGRTVEHGPAQRVLRNPASRTSAELLAASPGVTTHPTRRPTAGSPHSSDDHSAAPVARIDRVSRRYRGVSGDIPAVRDVSLSLHRGRITGVVGPSGSGKSTLARLTAGLESPDSGTVTVAEQTLGIGGGRVLRPGFVMPIFQDPASSLDSRWPLWRTVTEPLRGKGQRIPSRSRKRLAAAALARVGLDGIDVARLPGSLSVGQLQRVAVARAMQADPALLIADEPTASLDVIGAAAITELLRDIADEGTAMLIVSHDEPRLRCYADRIVRITDGYLVEEM